MLLSCLYPTFKINRYVDEIQCAAARIVAAIHERAYDPVTNPTGSFDTFHIRRGDFTFFYPTAVLSAEKIYQDFTRLEIPEQRTVYVATDERNMTYFQPLAAHYKLLYMNDFKHLLTDVNPNYFGMVDQLVCAMGETFFGTFYSTFSGYINRVRGYRAQNAKGENYEKGHVNSYYYHGEKPGLAYTRNMMQKYRSVRQGFWTNEFPVCWRDIDHDVTV